MRLFLQEDRYPEIGVSDTLDGKKRDGKILQKEGCSSGIRTCVVRNKSKAQDGHEKR